MLFRPLAQAARGLFRHARRPVLCVRPEDSGDPFAALPGMSAICAFETFERRLESTYCGPSGPPPWTPVLPEATPVGVLSAPKAAVQLRTRNRVHRPGDLPCATLRTGAQSSSNITTSR
jgi:hypothetical protein